MLDSVLHRLSALLLVLIGASLGLSCGDDTESGATGSGGGGSGASSGAGNAAGSGGAACKIRATTYCMSWTADGQMPEGSPCCDSLPGCDDPDPCNCLPCAVICH